MLLAPDLKAAVVLSDGQLINGSALVRGISEVLPNAVPITGGLAVNATCCASTWVTAD